LFEKLTTGTNLYITGSTAVGVVTIAVAGVGYWIWKRGQQTVVDGASDMINMEYEQVDVPTMEW